MGSGISSVCTSKRSILIANSVRKLPTIHEDDVDSDIEIEQDLEINPSSGKLHPAESRDSGIGENDIPHGYVFQKVNGSGSDSSPEKNNNDVNTDEKTRVSRPRSCRLGHRGQKGQRVLNKVGQGTDLSDSQIRKFVRSARDKSYPAEIEDHSHCDLSDDTLSLNSTSSASPDRRQSNRQPKSANNKRRSNKRNKSSTRGSTEIVNDLDTSTDTDGVSDTDMLSIPDETGPLSSSRSNRAKDDTPHRRGWVRTEDFTDVMITTSVTPRVGGHADMYRIVSGTYSDVDVNLAKKASERSISSIILTSVDGNTTPTNSECFDVPPNEMYYNHCEGNLEDLVTSLVSAIERLWSCDMVTTSDFEQVMKGLRYQLVAMAMGHMCRQSTPRIEVKGEQTNIFTDDTWRVQIRLRTEDEEIIESSEKLLAQRLAAKGRSLAREDISILLAEHLKSIEKLQQVQEAGKLYEQQSSSSVRHTTRTPGSDNNRLLSRRPQSAAKLRKLDTSRVESLKNYKNSITELPPIDKSKGGNGCKSKIKALPVPKKDNLNSESKQGNTVPSADKKADDNIGKTDDTDTDELKRIQEEDHHLFAELIEAFRQLWEALTSATAAALLLEYRRREARLIRAVIDHARTHTSNSQTQGKGSDQSSAATGNTKGAMGQQNSVVESRLDQGVQQLDDEFVSHFERNRDAISVDGFVEALTDHMKKTRLIRVKSFNIREDGADLTADSPRSNSFTGFGHGVSMSPTNSLKRQHTFCGTVSKSNTSSLAASRQNSFVKSLPVSRQSSYHRTRSRGSTGSSYTYSTTSSGVSSGVNSESLDSNASTGSKSAISREFSYGLLTDFEDIDEKDEELKTARENAASRVSAESLRPPSGRRSTSSRGPSGQGREREKRRGQTQTHGLGLPAPEPAHTPLRKIDEDVLPKVEELDSKMMVRSRPDSGIAVSTSSASYSSSELHKERDLDEPYITTSCQEMVEKVSKVLADQHNDLKSLVAAVTKGLNSPHSKAQALYCWLTSQRPEEFKDFRKKSNSPSRRLKQLHEQKTHHWSMYMDMLKVAGLKCERVDGYVKSSDYLPGNTVQTPKFLHSWVAIAMDGHFRLADPTYGALGDKFHREHYFATSPDELILSHFPKDKKWLLMNQPATIEVFEGTLKTWPAMFHFSIRPLNMKSVIRTYDGKLSITVLLQNVAVNPQLEYAGPGPEIDTDTLEEKIDHEIRDVDNAETYHVTLPQEGNYYFTVFAHVLEDGIDVPVFQYRIEYNDELL
ncbi:uncharacterized protein LOC128218359 isoform X2 [Mya arenaria]|uniref:uncharacterized protein LOC128218359 isoform X2 n=1 Tax=Mya arenaria TaxID=6604 RepID=UPI0022E8BD66|nr:uncharacterized protein LOC128218359 isoform X2 [Mya arenaria]